MTKELKLRIVWENKTGGISGFYREEHENVCLQDVAWCNW
jgi:hypothetical protein